MTPLSALWLPVLLSAVLVFVLSSIIHMMTPLHRNDFRRVPDDAKLADALRPLAIPPGDYMVPKPASMQDMKTPEFAERLQRGPNLIMTVLPNGRGSMGKSFVTWFVYSIVVNAFAAYIAGSALQAGAPAVDIFRFASTAAFMGYAVALWQLSIWYRRRWGTTLRLTIDGAIYALGTGAVLAWLWPR